MQIQRGALLARLEEAAAGVSAKETLEQSNCYVFTEGKLITFNGTIMVRAESPLPFNVVVNAADFKETLAKLPDDEIDITFANNEIRIKGKRRTAGIACTAEATLPFSTVPAPEKWGRLADGVLHAMLQAARVCGNDDAPFLATVVHITPERVEGCDNYRLFRADGATGFPGEVLIPAASVTALEGMELTKVSLGSGWCHFKTAGGAVISVVTENEKYHKSIDQLLIMAEGEKVTLPTNLKEIIERAEVFSNGAYDARIGIKLAEGELTLTARKEATENSAGGWYRERKKISYGGRALQFEINPQFLTELLAKSRDCEVDSRKMKMVNGAQQFVVCLEAKEEE